VLFIYLFIYFAALFVFSVCLQFGTVFLGRFFGTFVRLPRQKLIFINSAHTQRGTHWSRKHTRLYLHTHLCMYICPIHFPCAFLIRQGNAQTSTIDRFNGHSECEVLHKFDLIRFVLRNELASEKLENRGQRVEFKKMAYM